MKIKTLKIWLHLGKNYLLVMIGIFSIVGSSLGREILVSKSGIDKIGSAKFASLKFAIANASEKDIIYLEEGIYTESNIKIDKNISIIGQDRKTTIIQGIEKENIIEILVGTTVELSKCTIQNGRSQNPGGAILNFGDLKMVDCELRNNYSAGIGGGIAILNGNLNISDCIIYGNSAEIEGGGLYLANANLIMDNCHVDHNNSENQGGGIKANNSSLNITNSQITNNNAKDGSGLMLFSCGNTISNSQIENNGNSNSINGGLKIITVDQDQSTFLYTCSIKNNSGKQMKNDVHQVAYLNSKNYLQIQDSDFTHTIYFSEESGGQNLVLDSNGDKIKLIDKINYKTLINLADHSFPK